MSATKSFPSNIPLCPEICCFIGAVLGDGFLGTYNHQVQITGDADLDKEYYTNVLSPICESYFNYSPSITSSKSVIRLRIYSKDLKYFLHNLGIKIGVKCYTVTIPQKILKSSVQCKSACLQGLFDTDGGVYFDKRKIYKKPYVRVEFTSISKQLVQQMSSVLFELGVHHSIAVRKKSKAYRIQICGEKNTITFLHKIGFSNPRHLEKVRYLL